MKLRKAICIAAAICILCALCPMAAADGYSTPVNIMQYSVRPFTWEAQPRDNGDEMTWYISNLFDGYRETRSTRGPTGLRSRCGWATRKNPGDSTCSTNCRTAGTRQ